MLFFEHIMSKKNTKNPTARSIARSAASSSGNAITTVFGGVEEESATSLTDTMGRLTIGSRSDSVQSNGIKPNRVDESSMGSQVRDITLENSREFSLDGREMPAKVLRVVDGDTVVLGIYLFRNRWNVKCRCAGYNCAEIHALSAEERSIASSARERATQLLLDNIVQVQFGANDKYGRPLVSIILPNGHDLRSTMISGGYAAEYSGRGKKNY